MKWLLGLGIGLMVLFGFLVKEVGAVPGKPAFPEPDLARIVFIHLPCAFVTTVYFFWGAWCSFKVLKYGGAKWDGKARAAHELAMIFSIVTMITGIIFSKAQWGQWWSWDPRQTSFAVVMLIYGAYFAIRAAFEDKQRGQKSAAAYSIMALLPGLFFIFIMPRIMFSLHPSDTVQQGGFSKDYYMVVLGTFALLMALAVWLGNLASRAYDLEEMIENGSIQDGDGGGSGGNPVVRAVPVSSQD